MIWDPDCQGPCDCPGGELQYCNSLIPFVWHEQIRCERPAGHTGDHWCEDTGWTNEEGDPK